MQNVQVAPYTSGAIVDRQGFLSLTFAAATTTTGTLTLTIQHSDDEAGTFENVPDLRVAPEEAVATDAGGKPTPGVYNIDAVADTLLNVDLDLVGCKQFVSVAVSGAAASGATFAYALGDAQNTPL
jgi:hypothetical protein